MRTIALLGAAAIAASVMASGPAWAWSSEEAVPQGTHATGLENESFEALQEKANAASKANSGFYISGGLSPEQGSLSSFQSNPVDSRVPYGYSPMQGFRSR